MADAEIPSRAEVHKMFESAFNSASLSADGKPIFVVDWIALCCYMKADGDDDMEGRSGYGYMVLHSDMLPHVKSGLIEYANLADDGYQVIHAEEDDE